MRRYHSIFGISFAGTIAHFNGVVDVDAILRSAAPILKACGFSAFIMDAILPYYFCFNSEGAADGSPHECIVANYSENFYTVIRFRFKSVLLLEPINFEHIGVAKFGLALNAR